MKYYDLIKWLQVQNQTFDMNKPLKKKKKKNSISTLLFENKICFLAKYLPTINTRSPLYYTTAIRTTSTILFHTNTSFTRGFKGFVLLQKFIATKRINDVPCRVRSRLPKIVSEKMTVLNNKKGIFFSFIQSQNYIKRVF